MNVYVATRNRIKLQAVRDAWEAWHRDVEANVGAVDPPAGLPEQPLGDDVARGAIARAEAGPTRSDADFGIGVEAGVVQLPGSDRWFNTRVCAILDREERLSLGFSSGFEPPCTIVESVLHRDEMREVLRGRYALGEEEANRGLIYQLPAGCVDRLELAKDAVTMALLPQLERISRPRCN